jgi:hypothetical protein
MVLMAEEKNKLNWESINTLSFNDEFKVPLTLEESLNEISFRRDPSTQNYLEFSDIYGETWKPVMSANAILNLLKTVDSNDSGLNADTLDGYQPSIPVSTSNPVLSTVVVRDTDNSISANIIKFTTTAASPYNLLPGQMAWNSTYETLDLKLDNNVTLQVGQEFVSIVQSAYTVGEDITIVDGEVVYAFGSSNGYITVKKAQADSLNLETSKNVLGVATETIAPGARGFITLKGAVGSLDTLLFTPGDKLYLSPSIAGGLTNQKPNSPDFIVEVGYVVDSEKIYVNMHAIPNADEISYDNTASELLATNVKSALDELQLRKADIDMLSSNINLFPTTADSDIDGYFKMVERMNDPDYNTTAVNVSTGSISGENQLIASLAADPNVFVGNPGVIAITTIGNIRRVSGNRSAEFFFRVFKSSLNVNTQEYEENPIPIATSDTTGAIDPIDDNYREFSASAILNNGIFIETDRIIIKYYANRLGNSGGNNPVYNFQFGGLTPVRTLIPVPVSVIPTATASGILVNTALFNINTILQTSDSNVQAALERLNTHNHNNIYYTETELDNGQLDNRYLQTVNALVLGTTSTTAFRGDYGNTAYNHSQTTGNPHGTTAVEVGAEKIGTITDYTLLSSEWVGSTAPFTYQFTLSGITANTRIEWYLSLDAELVEAEAWSALNLQDGGNTNNTVNLKAYGEKPTIDIPVKYIIGGELNNA